MIEDLMLLCPISQYIIWNLRIESNFIGQEWTFDELKLNRLEHARKMGDKPGTLWETFHDMKAAGFGYVDCLWKSGNLARIAATKI